MTLTNALDQLELLRFMSAFFGVAVAVWGWHTAITDRRRERRDPTIPVAERIPRRTVADVLVRWQLLILDLQAFLLAVAIRSLQLPPNPANPAAAAILFNGFYTVLTLLITVVSIMDRIDRLRHFGDKDDAA